MCSTFNIPTSLHSYYIILHQHFRKWPINQSISQTFPGKKNTAIRWFFALDLAESHKVHFQVSESPESLEQRSDQGGPYHPPWKLKKGQARISSPHLCGHRNPAEVEIPAPQSTTMFWHCWSWMYLAILRHPCWSVAYGCWDLRSDPLIANLQQVG